MEKKNTIFSLIFVAFVVIGAVALIIISGITARDYNYVQLEVNPRVEFLCDSHFKVVSFKPLNEDAEILLCDVEYKGMDIEDASKDYLELCAKTGFIDVDSDNNAVNITVIDGLTQALDVHVTQEINEYLQKNEIMCAVVENYEDRKMFDNKKENKVCCANKYKLMTTIKEYDNNNKIESLNKLSEVKLIDMVENIHKKYKLENKENLLKIKKELIENNKEKYKNHINKKTDKSQQTFSKEFDKFQKTTGEKYRIDFKEEYTNWQNHQLA